MTLDINLITSALTDTIQRPKARAHLQAALAAGAAPSVRLLRFRHNRGDVSLLVCAAEHGWDEVVADLIAAGADVHIRNDAALILAADGGYLPVVETLLAAGADVHANHDEALCWAAASGHLPVVKRLLAAGADVHADNDDALYWAAEAGQMPVVACLLAAGADIHANNEKALYWAAMKNHLPVVEALLAAGADTGVVLDQSMRTVLLSALDACAAAIPQAQRQKVLSSVGKRMPALAALDRAEHRRELRSDDGAGSAQRAQKQPGCAAR